MNITHGLYHTVLLIVVSFTFLLRPVTTAVVSLTADNFDQVCFLFSKLELFVIYYLLLLQVANNAEVVFVNFYADWCRFSQMLTPIYAEAAEQFKDESASRVVWASVDCDRNPTVAQRFSVNKYPTLKLFRNGQLSKREYRGAFLMAYNEKHLCTRRPT